ncbi:hypothetical protein Glove_74g325 [Diversispora epigaea]|uniref:Transposase Tc1-like domain-containing protein n=1 Tax=Diversispora epigaea TaxID=1348612 RepID=A0A397JBM3_9GLOM|nr:hypothetical protein Glove_74g325 [Diversispora epigaea]
MASSKLEAQRQTILHFWRQEICNAAKIYSLTLKTIYRNLKKLQDTGDVKRKGGSGRIKKNNTKCIPENGAVYLKATLTFCLVSCCKIGRYWNKCLPFNSFKTLRSWILKCPSLCTPMLTTTHKQKRIEWAQKHKNYNWKKTLFSDKTAF